MTRTVTEAEDATITFMHALADADDIDACNISAETTPAGIDVYAWVAPTDVGAAESLAAENGLTLYGETLTALKAKYNAAAADGRRRYRFEHRDADR